MRFLIVWILVSVAVHVGVLMGRAFHEWRAVRSARRALCHQAARIASLARL